VNSKRAIGAGAFVVIGALLFTVALFMIGERRSMFTKRFPVYVEFSRLGQLQSGAIVRVAGADAGAVTEIRVPRRPSDPFRVRLEIREEFWPLIRTDSVAVAQSEGLVGAMFVDIAPGTEGAAQVPVEGTIPGKEPYSVNDLLQQMSETVTTVNTTVQTLSGEVQKTISEITQTAAEAHGLLRDVSPDLQAIAHNGARISSDAEQVMSNLNDGHGTLGQLLKDDTLYKQMRDLTTQAQSVMEDVRAVTVEAKGAIADFRSPDGPTQGLIGDARTMVSEARDATASLADNMEALKHNFLLRGFFNKRGYYNLDLISPAEYRSGILENGNRRALRIWLGADVLFEHTAAGVETLGASGQARVDSAMATFLRYVPSHPIVIEGYATDGSAGERFQTGRTRAGIVRQYVMTRYRVPQQNIGAIALDETPSDSPSGNQRWDGVAITLFLDRDELQFEGQRRASR
jgi:phospholipid/cholesterol/gamma-HCH transport system substrate-binding protein